jgi:opacity protein-like surface antigen
MNRTVLLFMGVIATWAFVPRLAQAQTGSGFYLSSELGVQGASSLNMTGSSNDRASVCDEFINPMYAMVETVSGYGSYNCTGPRGSTGDWKNDFDGVTGLLAGAAVGYSFQERYPDNVLGQLRLELEYFFRNSEYDQTSDVHSAEGESGDKLVQELVRTVDRISSITSHNLFGNLYFDFVNNSRFTPYLGVGGGIGFTHMNYGGLWARNFDANRITTGEGLSNAQEIRQNLAGTSSPTWAVLHDTPVGFQMLWGVDYAMTESMSLGVKGRWVSFGSFSDSGIVWDPLRGHVPNLRRDGSEPVSGWVTFENMGMFGVSVNLKCHF